MLRNYFHTFLLFLFCLFCCHQVDVPGGCRSAETFFESFETSFTTAEWQLIRGGYPGDGCGGPSLDDPTTLSSPSTPLYSTPSSSGAKSKALAGGDAGAFRRFYRFWALKEAYIKAHGLGLGIDLQSIEFRLQAVTQNGRVVEGSADGGRDGESSGGSAGSGSGSGGVGYVWRVCVDGASTPAMHWAFSLERVDDRHVVCVALAPPQVRMQVDGKGKTMGAE